MTADSASDYAAMCVFSSRVCLQLGNSRRRAAGVCAGGAWQVRSSPGGSGGCRADTSTPEPRRPGQTVRERRKTLEWLPLCAVRHLLDE